MNTRSLLVFAVLAVGSTCATSQRNDLSGSGFMNLQQSVELALNHNHDVRLASLKVEEDRYAKEVARSAYMPVLRNESTFVHVTDTQLIGIPPGAFGSVNGIPVPTRASIISQGGKTFETSGTGLVQPVTQLFKVKAANDIARAEIEVSKGKTAAIRDQIALRVRQLYYQILIVQSQQEVIQAKIRAADDLQAERIQQVKFGTMLEADLIESRAQSLQAKQDLLALRLELSDLRMHFNDVVGLPIRSEVALDPNLPSPSPVCSREECVKLALDSNPEIAEARAEVDKAYAGVRAAKREYIPDVEALARYSYQNDVPFLARNFGTFGVHLSYDVFDGGRKRAMLSERDIQLTSAKENLARVRDEIEVRVQTACNKLERTEQMVAVSRELLTARKEAHRVSAEGLTQGTDLRSHVGATIAQEAEAQTMLLQAELEYAQAQDELNEAIGRSE